MIHPGLISFLANKYFRKEVFEIANESMIELGAYGDDLGVLTTFENMPAFESMIYENMDELNEFLTDNNLYMTLDVGHANHVGYSADDMIFDCIKHVHMHDNFGDDDAHLPLGEGSIDLKRVVNNLESKKYDGIYILEVNDYDSIKKSYEYIKKNLEIVNSLCLQYPNNFYYGETSNYISVCNEHIPYAHSLEQINMCQVMRDTHVSFIPGYINGFDKSWGFCYRINLTLNSSAIRNGLGRLFNYFYY